MKNNNPFETTEKSSRDVDLDYILDSMAMGFLLGYVSSILSISVQGNAHSLYESMLQYAGLPSKFIADKCYNSFTLKLCGDSIFGMYVGALMFTDYHKKGKNDEKR